MKGKVFLKNIISDIAYPIGKYFAYVPFNFRLGAGYSNSLKQIDFFNNLSKDEQVNYSINKLNKIVSYASTNFEFYKKLYTDYGIIDHKIKYLDDFEKFPILTKEKIRNYVDTFNGAMKINTGGTSGEPFSFYIDKNAFAREWAHMHKIWNFKGYKQTDLKITLRGKNLGNKNIVYNPVHNEFIINTYKSLSLFKNELVNLFRGHKIKYVHGYPSAIYEFFKELESLTSRVEKNIIQKNIVSCFFGSEFPMPNMIRYLEENWNLDYISWYGHSEMAILAYDENKTNDYKSFMTYGYTEVVDNKLIGTSYNNFDMPLIRYDTGDLVEAKYQLNGLLESFSVKEGREGDYIIDKKGKRIPLTSLIFGRHHIIFNIADFIQVGQDKNGLVTFYITLKDTNILSFNKYFDLTNIDIEYVFERLSKPIKSKAGKMKLKIDKENK
jgi:phenylacetate-CoA ligase